MQGNPDEFQAMCIGKKQKENKDENRIQPDNYLMLPNMSN